MKSKEEEDAENIAKAHEIVGMIEDALHKTISSAINPGVLRPRKESKKAWQGVADKIIEFAMEDK